MWRPNKSSKEQKVSWEEKKKGKQENIDEPEMVSMNKDIVLYDKY